MRFNTGDYFESESSAWKQGLGLFYWEFEGAKSWIGYGLSAWGLMENLPKQWMHFW